VAPEEIKPDQRRVHHPPLKESGMEFGGRQWPCPRAHDDDRSDTARIAHGQGQAGRTAPIVTNNGDARHIELTDKADEIGDVAIERVRLLARGFLGDPIMSGTITRRPD
jgi:hypothetical protein